MNKQTHTQNRPLINESNSDLTVWIEQAEAKIEKFETLLKNGSSKWASNRKQVLAKTQEVLKGLLEEVAIRKS